MFETQFSHYLSYGAADQQTVTELRGVYDALLVPGTVAAFQKEGTGGFVLALSASEPQIPYVIDPRSPLFQQEIPVPKKSHLSLASILGLPEDYKAHPESFTDDLIKSVAENWVKFNGEYQDKSAGKFQKYAKRLGEEGLDLQAASPPHLILSPYFVANSTTDAWWQISEKLHMATCEVAAKILPGKKCVRVVATEQAVALDDLCEALPESSELVVWVSDLNEISALVSDLEAYGRAIRNAEKRGQKLFGLYGGFFSVVLSNVGLKGASHGIGYGESRNWIELPQSGPPPARYYSPAVHRYISQELAEQLWQVKISQCSCRVCESSSPILLDYHDLMMHSVYCRADEISSWSGTPLDKARERLKKEHSEFVASLDSSKMSRIFKQQAEGSAVHLGTWVQALTNLAAN